MRKNLLGRASEFATEVPQEVRYIHRIVRSAGSDCTERPAYRRKAGLVYQR